MENTRLSRAWFDVIVLALVTVVTLGAAAYHYWPIGCADHAIVDLAAEHIRQELGADRVTLHLIKQTSAAEDEITCAASGRLEFKARDNMHRDIAYRARFDKLRHIADVVAIAGPVEP